jgi:E3 ubiquitin-protein ligase SHPRH
MSSLSPSVEKCIANNFLLSHEPTRHEQTLRYLTNQFAAAPETCVVCLRVLEGECSVLRCGHRFHQNPCFDQILSRSGNRVFCPMKCPEGTHRYDVMIASCKPRDDGSCSSREVRGSYGTKVTRIVSDILNMRDRGEKGVVFSQWNDMLEIVESALAENGVVTARPMSTSLFGESVRRFRSPDCAVLLLNLKQGAEGLTLTMATHVFMIEPVMNAALDKQATNRIHRIGQNQKTHVWRYLIENTIEIKLDRMRLKQQGDDGASGDPNDSSRRASSAFPLGGLDGCFDSCEELLEVLSET